MVQHISIRVPWTDNGFIGRICDCPLKNYACHRLKAIAENSSLLCQKQDMEGKPFNNLDNSDKRLYLPCITEGKAFMADTEITLECYHRYAQYYDSHRDFTSSIQHIPPYTLVARPFRWLMRGDTGKRTYSSLLRDLNNIPDIDDQIAPLLMRNANGTGKPVGKDWIQHSKTQEQIFTKFFEDVVPNQSLCFIYTKSVPYVEDSDRILLGIAVVDKPVLLPQKHAKKPDATSPLESFAWECMVQHKIRKDGEKFLADNNGIFGGFLLPYAQIIDKIEHAPSNKDKEKYISDLQSVVISVPGDFREDFSYASEHVSHDAAISVLLQTKKSLSKIMELGYVGGNIVDCLAWIDKEIDFLWQDRPVYPDLGIMLAVVLNGIPGCSVSKELDQYIQNNPDKDPFKVLTEWIANKKTPLGIEFTTNHQLIWNRSIMADLKTLESFKRIARTSMSFIQAECLWEKIVNNTVNITKNPYTIYTSTIYEEESKKVSLYCVDLAFFVPKQYRTKFFGESQEYIESADDPYRVTGFATYVLSNAASEGHTYLPVDELLKRISEINVQEPCVTDSSTLKLYDQEYFSGLIRITDNENGRFYKLVYFDNLDKKIRELVDERIMLEALTFDQSKFNIKLPDGVQSNSKVIQEQSLAAESIAKSAISVLCGSAGTGKTTLLTNLCKSFTNRVLLLAPTGKARVRMQQNIAQNLNCDTNTIAGYLVKLDSVENGKKCYDYNTGRYILPKQPDLDNKDVDVIIDESSMLTEEMFGALLVALQKAKRIIFVGDISQLPPIGAGRPFYELVHKLQNMNHGFAELKTQVRFLNNANPNPLDVELSKHFSLNEAVRAQAKDEVFKLLDKTPTNDRLSFVEWDNPDDLRVKLAEILKDELNMDSVDDVWGFNRSLGATEWEGQQYFKSGNEYPPRTGIGNFADKWQIITPLRNRFDVGTVGINAFIHDKYRTEMLKAEIEQKKQNYWYPLPLPGEIIKGDKVINLINTKIKPANKPSDMQYHNPVPVANGEIGILGQDKAYGKRVYGVEFSSQPMKCFPYTADNFGDESTPILELAYAITVHKSQGSDFDTVILIMGEHMPLASREMLYTALTRQKKRLVILYNGDISSLKDLKMDSKSSLLTRYSDLFEPAKNINFDGIGDLDKSKYIHVTDTGVKVISKSEVIVANTLSRHGIKYRYENPLKLEGRDKPIKPDFTIEYNGKTYYWEHLGMLSQESYRNKWMLKLELYRKNGIEPITSKDDANGGIDSGEIEKIIQEKILGAQ